MTVGPHSTLRQQLAAVANGRTSVYRLAQQMIERIAERDTQVRAFEYIDTAKALRRAKALDAGPAQPYRGLIFAVKDNYDTHDMPTAYGSAIHAGAQPPRDAALVAALRIQGGLLLGKTVTTEFAHRCPGPTTNPWNAAHTPGGSSSGSAAAVAAGFVALALGSQTTGSVIRPAAYCGAVGYKPTYGDLNTSGMLANTPSFDTAGLFARHIDDLVLARAALLGDSHAPLSPPPIERMRIGLSRSPWWQQADADARTHLHDAARVLRAGGAEIIEFDDDPFFVDLETHNRTVSGFEFARTLAHERLYAEDALSSDLRDGRMRDGLEGDYETYITAQARLEQARLAMDERMDRLDVLITLPAPGAAPAGLGSTGPATFNMAWTTLHMPALTLPLYTSAAGLPIGLQVCAKRRRDRHLLAHGLALTAALGG
ncbi:MAG: amidase [Gammaproteobacteria bacterium]|nr:amidase [Gammaproteobacteria bacterium]